MSQSGTTRSARCSGGCTRPTQIWCVTRSICPLGPSPPRVLTGPSGKWLPVAAEEGGADGHDCWSGERPAMDLLTRSDGSGQDGEACGSVFIQVVVALSHHSSLEMIIGLSLWQTWWLQPSASHRDNSTSRLAKSSSGPVRRLKWWFQGLAYTLNSFLLSIFTNHRYFSLWLSIIAFPFQASIHINTKSARFKGRTYLADDPICIHLHNNN